MSHTPHELHEEFPEMTVKIRHLRETDGHFFRITEEYHRINGVIHRAETDVEPMDDAHVAELRKQRMLLKDEIYGLLVRHEEVAPLP